MASWENWAGIERSDAPIVEPESLPALEAVVRRAGREGRRMRASGSRMSWTPLVPVDAGGIIISMTKLNRILAVDPRKSTVTVECGITKHPRAHCIRHRQLRLDRSCPVPADG